MSRNTKLMRDGLAIFTFSFLALALEILDTRIISVILGPNFVYLVVGIAILGFSGAGAYTAYRSHCAAGRYTPRPGLYAIAFAFSLVLPILLICACTTFLDAGGKIGIGIVSLSLAIPFFFAGLVIVSLLSARAGRIGAVYGLNLAGSAFGCFLPVIGLRFFSAGTLLFFLGLVATLAVFLPGPRERLSLKGGTLFLNLVLLLISLPLLNNPLFIRPVSYKELSYLLRERPDMKIEYQKWSPIGRIDVVCLEDPYIYLPDRTGYKLVTQDGNAPTILLSHEKPVREADFARSTILGLPRGKDEQRDMPGTRIALLRKGQPAVWRRVRIDGSYCSANDPRILIGLGNSDEFEAIMVHWPNGERERWSGLAPRQYHTLIQGAGAREDDKK